MKAASNGRLFKGCHCVILKRHRSTFWMTCFTASRLARTPICLLPLQQFKTPTLQWSILNGVSSLCFALATGVGKTRLMGAFIAYMFLTDRSSNFLVLAPNTTIYNKLIDDFTQGSAKYVLKGIAEFTHNPPVIVTGDNWDDGKGVRGSDLFDSPIINISMWTRSIGIRAASAKCRNISANLLTILPACPILDAWTKLIAIGQRL